MIKLLLSKLLCQTLWWFIVFAENWLIRISWNNFIIRTQNAILISYVLGVCFNFWCIFTQKNALTCTHPSTNSLDFKLQTHPGFQPHTNKTVDTHKHYQTLSTHKIYSPKLKQSKIWTNLAVCTSDTKHHPTSFFSVRILLYINEGSNNKIVCWSKVMGYHNCSLGSLSTVCVQSVWPHPITYSSDIDCT